MRRHAQAALLAIAGAVAAEARTAGAAPSRKPDAIAPAEENAAKEEGDRLFRAKRYADAVAKYDEAYAERPNPALLYNRGRAYEGLERYADALESLERFSAEAPPTLLARVPKLNDLIAEVRRHTSRLVVRCNVSGAQVVLGEKLLGTTPISPRVVDAGMVVLSVKAEGYRSDVRRLALVAGVESSADIVLQEVPRAASPVPPAAKEVDRRAPAITSRWWFWTSVAVVVVGAAIGVFFAATSEKSPSTGDRFEPTQVRF